MIEIKNRKNIQLKIKTNSKTVLQLIGEIQGILLSVLILCPSLSFVSCNHSHTRPGMCGVFVTGYHSLAMMLAVHLKMNCRTSQ